MPTVRVLAGRLPVLGSAWRRHGGRAKREICLALHAAGRLRPFTFVQWLVTSRCNFACAFCEASAGAADPAELTTAEAEAFIDDLGASGVRRLLLAGGEPLVREDVPGLAARAARRGMKLGLVSNGFLLPLLWPQLEELPWYLLFTSLDGPREVHDRMRAAGSYDRVLRTLELMGARGVATRIVNTVVQPSTLGHLPELRAAVAGSGGTRWHLTPLSAVGRAAGDPTWGLDGDGLRRLLAFVRDASGDGLTVDFGESHRYLWCLDGGDPPAPVFCGAGLTRCSVLADGTVMGCHQSYDPRHGEGNLRERPFSDIWHTGFARFRTRALDPSCGDCAHRTTCGGGCRAEMDLHGRCLKGVWEAGQAR